MQPIVLEQVNKSYGDLQAVKNISFAINEGEIFGLIGPDGAGKTTLMRMIVSLLIPDKGKISFVRFFVGPPPLSGFQILCQVFHEGPHLRHCDIINGQRLIMSQ